MHMHMRMHMYMYSTALDTLRSVGYLQSFRCITVDSIRKREASQEALK